MTFLRKALISTAGLAVLGSMGYLVYGAFAVQGQGTLAQAPLNIQSTVPPAFIMGVDNSGSMSSDETLFRTGQGIGYFRTSNYSFFDSAGVAWESGGTSFAKVVTSHDGERADLFGAARAPEYNRAYFNPAVTYTPWRQADGTFEPDSDYTDAPEDPRAAYNDGNIDFSAVQTSTYNFQAGMRLHAGTRYYNGNACNNSPTPGSGLPTNAWQTLSADIVFAGSCSTQFEYIRGVVYLSETAPAPIGFDLSKRELIEGAGPAGANLYKYEYKLGNFTTGGAAALTNFANWYTYYGNRNRAMIAAMTESMADVTNMRVGYFQINPPLPATNVQMYDIEVPTDKQSLYALMRNLNSSGNTPTRRAVDYMARQFRRTDTGAPIQLVCQKNAGMLFTDGYTNDNNVGLTNVGDTDGALAAPFGGGVASSNTIADLAMDAYLNNLRPDLAAGKVPVPGGCSAGTPDPSLDCQKNLHMNFYGITLGARGAIYDVNAAATANPYTTPPSWGATGTMSLQPENVDDIWHAAINTRGEFINAKSPTDISQAMRRILASVGAGTTPSGSIGLTGSRVGTGSVSVVPSYTAANNGTDWFSTLTAQTVTSDPITGAVSYSSIWEASSQLPAAGSRNILVGKTTGSVVPSVSTFDSTNVSLDELCDGALSRCVGSGIGRTAIDAGLGINLAEAVAYLRGDQTLETSATKPLRQRTTLLGDIVNSNVVVSSPLNDYGYKSLRGATAGTFNPFNYDAYLATKKTRTPMVYVGANDGMLHAFDGVTGIEKFAYIPATSLGHMGNLLFPYKASDKDDQLFDHRYFVDGPVTVSDAYYTGSWKTVLVGTTGAGGRGVFALNVSTPGSFGASNVLWDINDGASDANIKNNIGHVLGKPVVVPVKIGTVVKWKAIFGNGYNSINNKAVLFVVDIDSGAVTTIQASEASQPGANGLGNVIVLDRYDGSTAVAARDGYGDTVYAGDQNGAVWKFDLRSASPSALTSPFFVATDPSGNRQSIIGGFEAAAGPAGGVMLYFGTGSFSFINDPTDKQVQTLYAVLDRGATVSRSQLHQQTVVSDVAGVRQTSMTAPPVGKLGWHIDLVVGGVASGERFVGTPRIESGVVFFPTFDPNSTDSCVTGGTNRLYGLGALNGAAGLSAVRIGSPTGTSPGAGTGAVPLSTSGSSPVKEVAVLTSPRLSPLASTATAAEVAAALAARCSMVIQVAGAPPLYMPRPCGRQSWRQVR
ncbi:pilus assembly protein [Lysobacter koreensis]|uniref:Pilus assembly protein n=1 Tax=Lysobacter koreensis TaxID=266122 RepID=A0ABW2YPA1_9GAMM